MTHTYDAIIKKQGDYYTVDFPAFVIKGRGCAGLEDSIAFAEDFLAEIILDWEAKGKKLPPKEPLAGDEARDEASGETSSEAPDDAASEAPYHRWVVVDTDRYRRRIEKNANRVFYDFETDRDVKERNEKTFAPVKVIVPAAVVALAISVIIVMMVHAG